jgi:hypothetical protein
LDEIEPNLLEKRAEFPQRRARPAVQYLNAFSQQETKHIRNNMKTLLAVLLALGFITSVNAQSTNATDAASLGPRTGPAYYSPPNSPYKKWTTAQLQQRRLDLYRQTPQRQDRHGRPVFIHHSGEGESDQQKEIYAIEAELNYRYQHGDKDAELKRAMPGQQHP